MSYEISIDSKMMDKYVTILDVAGKNLIPEIDKAVATTMSEGKRYIIEKTPHITGNLRRGFQGTRVAPGVWMIYNLVKYVHWIEEGVREVKKGTGKYVYMGKTTIRKATKKKPALYKTGIKGGVGMVRNSIKEMNERLALNIGVALDFLLAKAKGA